MRIPNVILLSMDEVRADDLSCYGQKEITTPAIDSLAKDGVIFEKCRTAAPWTPVSMASMLSGTYPNKHGKRDSISMWTPCMTLAEIMKINGYLTAGWTGASLLTEKYGFNVGFDVFKSPNRHLGMRGFYPEYSCLNDEEFNERMLQIHEEAGVLNKVGSLPEQYWWINEVISWLEANNDENFFIWCHMMETHTGYEPFFIYHELLKENEYRENSYKLGHVLMADNYVIKPLIENMKRLDLYDKTIMILASDHGTICYGRQGWRPIPPHQYNPYREPYPWHTTLFDADVRVVNIWRGPGLPKGKRITGQVRTVDTVPTILDLCGIDPPEKVEFDGVSLLPFIKKGKAEGLIAYIEHLQEDRQFGCQQALCTGRYKFIRSLTTGAEELYDLKYDPEEYINLLNSSAVPYGMRRKATILEDPVTFETLVKWRKELNKYLLNVSK